MKEVFRLSIKRVQTNERIEIICEKCGKVVNYLIIVNGKENACCESQMKKILRGKKCKYQIH